MSSEIINVSYIGQKGYTIPKTALLPKILTDLKRDLIAKPFIIGSPNSVQNQNTYPVYRESASKIYIPRYFGEKKFGTPKMNSLPECVSINVPFQGSLRENQIPPVNAYIQHVTRDSDVGGGGGLLELPCAYGKTTLSLYICSQLQKKTLVIVHKEFLMNQWIERIKQFLPTARIGKIQGKNIDVENKDIVIGMLQSLSMKTYDSKLFAQFGLTIIDEVHHISSEVFSCALFKIVSKYMLGLSATMNRKDGTTNIFKMFLGDVIYKGKRDQEHSVIVKAIWYKSDDEDFNKVETDYRGNIQYSTMISKLCTFNCRTEFILTVLENMIKESPDQQIMILAHNKNILTYLHDAITHRNISTVGYYVGGMKEQSLKESEGKQVIIATYSMASEALDIKTLTTLIMATPKTDIEQAVGRILRVRHSNPVVVDIIDSHYVFQNQWKKRMKYYNSQKYIIERSNSNRLKYSNSTSHKDYNDEDGDEDKKDAVLMNCLLPTTSKEKF